MVSVGKIEKTEFNGLTVDGQDVMDQRIIWSDKAWDGVACMLSTDAGDYLYNYSGDLKPDYELTSGDIVNGCWLLLSFVPFNYNL